MNTNTDVEYDEQIELDLLRKRALRARVTIIEMLKDRQYEVSASPIKTVLPIAKDLYIKGESSEKGLIGVFWTFEAKFRTEEARALCLEIERLGLKRVILVTPEGELTSTADYVLGEYSKAKGVVIELFVFSELQFNPSKHMMIPRYRILHQSEIPAFQEAYQIVDIQQIPHMLTRDILCRYLGLSRGDIVQFRRADGSLTYRLVW